MPFTAALHQRVPAPPLSRWIEKLWYCEIYPASHRCERVLPDGRFQLVIGLAGSAPSSLVVGMRSAYALVETARMQSTVGVVFRPGGAASFFASPSDEFLNRTVPLDLLWGSRAANLPDRLLDAPTPGAKIRAVESALIDALRPRELHPAVRYALGEFPLMPSHRRVLEVSAAARLSRRRFAQLFREQVGLTPKLYCRLLRFQQIVRSASAGGEIHWADLALDGGYSDQAHLAHEFRAFSGVSPSDWLSANRPFQNHAAVG